MGATKEWFIRLRDEQYQSLSPELRQSFLSESVYYPEEHKTLYASDENYKRLHDKYRKAKKERDEYAFRKRHGS